jgi:hypothetical protein
MKTNQLTASVLFASLLLLAGCGGCNSGDAATMQDGTANTADGAATTTDNAAATAGSDAAAQGGTNAADADGAASANGAAGAGDGADTMKPRTFTDMKFDTPEAERNGCKSALEGLRATLKAELDQVRDGLRTAGGDKEMQKAKQQRAAELAQGLERMDRLIKKIGETTDVQWADVRQSSLTEAEEVRNWMSQYGLKNSI